MVKNYRVLADPFLVLDPRETSKVYSLGRYMVPSAVIVQKAE